MKRFMILAAVLALMTALLPVGQALAAPSMSTGHDAIATSSQIARIPPRVGANLLPGFPFGLGLFNPFLGIGNVFLSPFLAVSPFLGVRALLARQLLLRQALFPLFPGIRGLGGVELDLDVEEFDD
ncbi:MAG: hypothetical protein HY671_15375 [Chloroflexi bacterium]|nr:hypothetical protein [Chloroflexota bacterium]